MKTENDISFAIRGAIFRVNRNLGPGLLESVYEKAMVYELTKMGYTAKAQIGVPMLYENIEIDVGFRLDIIVNDKVIIEIKSVEKLIAVHHKQLLTYLKLSDKKLGLLVNFNTLDIKDSIVRIVNGL